MIISPECEPVAAGCSILPCQFYTLFVAGFFFSFHTPSWTMESKRYVYVYNLSEYFFGCTCLCAYCYSHWFCRDSVLATNELLLGSLKLINYAEITDKFVCFMLAENSGIRYFNALYAYRSIRNVYKC
jgi:hypothetical protein